jgi:DNA-directed RNA polymerase specialized sigma subunit
MPRRTITRKYHLNTAIECLDISTATFYMVGKENKEKINDLVFNCVYNKGYTSLINIKEDILTIIRSDDKYKQNLKKLNKKHRIKILTQAYKGIKPTTSILLELKNYEGLNYEEVGSIFGISKQRVYQRLHYHDI